MKFSFWHQVCCGAFFFLKATLGLAEAPKQEAQDSLQLMAGCFSVTFQYIEDGIYDAFYAPVLEKAVVSSQDPLTFTRTLIVDGVEDLHWSDTWTQVAGNLWKQTVIGPYEDLRYECEGSFIQNQWSCLAPNAVKPRRDRARPYVSLTRHNTLQINNKRWVHVQNNQKIKADGSLLSVEMGWNRYDRRPDSECVVLKPSPQPTPRDQIGFEFRKRFYGSDF